MSDKPESSIRAAVKDCLARCYKGNTPLGVLAEYLADLREQGWTASDVRQVEGTVRKMLAGVVQEETDSED